MFSLRSLPLSLVALAGISLGVYAWSGGEMGGHTFVTPDDMKFGKGPDALPPGIEFAMLEGTDLSKPEPFTLRIKMPDGYRIPPHWHPAIEHVTILEGTGRMGLGDTFEPSKMHELPKGSFAVMPKEMHHFFEVRGATVIQLHGVGPWGVTYVNPADDPRSKKEKP